jgi:uncharacterized protein (TIGR00266 family)
MDGIGKNGRGSYLGEPPRRAGFGRKSVLSNTQDSGGFTLSQAAAPDREAHNASAAILNDIDFSIGGGDMQFVEVELDPGESVVAEPGAMIWKDSAIVFDTTLGDGSASGLGGKLLSAGLNAMAGENLFLADFRHAGAQGKARVALGGRVPGHVIPVRLDAMGGSLICQRRSFLAAAKGVKISIAMQRRVSSMLFGEEGFVMQRLIGTGWVFLHVGGTIIERDLAAGEIIQVDGGCVAAHEPQVDMDIDTTDCGVRGIKNFVVGGESLFLTTMRGPGKVWLQTLPFSRIATEAKAAEAKAAAAVSPLSVGSAVTGGDIVDGFNTLRNLF